MYILRCSDGSYYVGATSDPAERERRIVTALEDKASKESPLEHKLVKLLMSDFVEAISELEARKA